MALFSRKKVQPTNQRTYAVSPASLGTWSWTDDESSWTISLNNRLESRLSLMQFTSDINEVRSDHDFPKMPTPGKRMRTWGMYGFGDDYRWFVTIHGLDGRRYFFENASRVLSQNGIELQALGDAEIDALPFESDDALPDSPTHPPQSLVSETDQQGASEMPTVSIADESSAGFLAQFTDFTESDYDELCFYLFGGAPSWQEKVLNELKRRKETDTFDSNALDAAVRKHLKETEQHQDAMTRRLASEIESRLRKARGYEFDPPGGWGAMGPV
jgi:hypothetical protein